MLNVVKLFGFYDQFGNRFLAQRLYALRGFILSAAVARIRAFHGVKVCLKLRPFNIAIKCTLNNRETVATVGVQLVAIFAQQLENAEIELRANRTCGMQFLQLIRIEPYRRAARRSN